MSLPLRLGNGEQTAHDPGPTQPANDTLEGVSSSSHEPAEDSTSTDAPLEPVQSSEQDAGPNHAFAEALNQYVATLPNGVKRAFQEPVNLEAFVAELAKSNETHTHQSRLRRFLQRAEKVMRCLDGFFESVVIAIQHDPHISSLVVGAVRLTLSLGLRFHAYFESISSTLEMITDHLPFLQRYAITLFRDVPEVRRFLVQAYTDLLDICYHVWTVFHDELSGKIRTAISFTILRRTVWNKVDHAANAARARFERHTELIVREARTVMYAKDIEFMDRSYQEMLLSQQQRDYEAEQRRIQKRKEVIQWLSDDDYASTQEHVLSNRYEQSGSWLLQHSDFQTWLQSEQSTLLWCHGNPGVGKTVLASIVSDYLQQDLGGRPDTAFAHVFCSYRDQKEPGFFIRSYLRQLVTQLPYLPTGVEDRYDELSPNCKNLSMKDIAVPSNNTKPGDAANLLAYLIEKFRKTVLVFDALDECPDRGRWLLPLLQKLVERYSTLKAPTVKIFITSRVQPDIYRAFSEVPTIAIEATNVDTDIRAYVHGQLEQRIAEGSLVVDEADLVDTISTSLTSQSNGMFLWVKYQIDYVCSHITDRQILDSLQSLPEDLYAHYDRVLQAIDRQPEKLRQIAKTTFSWLAGSFRRLHRYELAEALAIHPAARHWSDLDIVKNTDRILHACHNLLTTLPDGSITFMHYSVQEYFLSLYLTQAKDPALQTYAIELDSTKSMIAKACLTYLALEGLCLRKSPPSDLDGAFSYYAGSWITQHLSASQAIATEMELISLAIRTFSRPGIINHIQVLEAQRSGIVDRAWARTPLEFAAKVGFKAVVSEILQRYPMVSQDEKEKALRVAHGRGHEEVETLLIYEGVHLGVTSPRMRRH